MGKFCKRLPKEVQHRIEALYEDAVYCWRSFESEDENRIILGVEIANHGARVYLEEYEFESDETAEAEATRLNGELGIDDDMAVKIMRSDGWYLPDAHEEVIEAGAFG